MSAFALSALFLAIGSALAALTAIIAAKLAHQNWQNQHWEQKREERRTAALATVNTLSLLVDRRLYRQRKFLWALRRGNEKSLEAARLEYAAVVAEWMENLGRMKASLWADFDRYTMIDFEERIHDEFARIGKSLEAGFRNKRLRNLYTEESDLNRLGKTSYEFSNELLQRINAEDISGLRGRWSLDYENWDNLSSCFLLSRLFDLGKNR